jgi:hypothetical protein
VYSLFLSFVSILAVLPSVLLYPATHTPTAVAGICVGIPPGPTDAIAAGTTKGGAPGQVAGLEVGGVANDTVTVAVGTPGTPNTVIVCVPTAAVRHSVVPVGRVTKLAATGMVKGA